MGVLPQIAKRLDELDWILPTDIQADAIPIILGDIFIFILSYIILT